MLDNCLEYNSTCNHYYQVFRDMKDIHVIAIWRNAAEERQYQ